MKEKKDVYVGYLGLLDVKEVGIEDAEVTKFKAVPEIRHKQWKERGLDAPLQQHEMPQYSFSDLMMTLYYEVHIA
jgi:hypothetical protein